MKLLLLVTLLALQDMVAVIGAVEPSSEWTGTMTIEERLILPEAAPEKCAILQEMIREYEERLAAIRVAIASDDFDRTSPAGRILLQDRTSFENDLEVARRVCGGVLVQQRWLFQSEYVNGDILSQLRLQDDEDFMPLTGALVPPILTDISAGEASEEYLGYITKRVVLTLDSKEYDVLVAPALPNQWHRGYQLPPAQAALNAELLALPSCIVSVTVQITENSQWQWSVTAIK